MVTLREVAEEAGVSLSTVSAVVNGQADVRRIAEPTRVRVQRIAARLGYCQNALASGLRAGRTNCIGIVGFGYPFIHHALRVDAAARALADHGYRVMMQNLAWRSNGEASLLRELLGLRVEGLLVEGTGGTPETRQILKDLARQGFPMVRFDMTDTLPVDIVTVDREHGAYKATCHLFALGHRRIAFALPGDTWASVIQDRLRGYRRAHDEWGVPPDEGLQAPYDQRRQFPGYQVGRESMQHVLRMQPRPTALLATDDHVAIGALGAALEAGLRVPDDLAMVSFVNFPESEYAAVPLTTVAFPFTAMAGAAVQMLKERVDGEVTDVEPRVIVLKPELVVRRSCGASLPEPLVCA